VYVNTDTCPHTHALTAHLRVQLLRQAHIAPDVHFVEEAAGARLLPQRRPIGQQHVVAKHGLQRGAQHVGRRVPQDLLKGEGEEGGLAPERLTTARARVRVRVRERACVRVCACVCVRVCACVCD
jgi:hypothetical protein